MTKSPNEFLPGSDPKGPTKILVIEDEDDFDDMEMMARQIQGISIDVRRASSVQEGISSVSAGTSNIPDVAIVDVRLEDSNGLDFVRWARERNLPFPIIVVSQDELRDVRYNGRPVSLPALKDLGATEFQSKPTIAASYPEFIRYIVAVRFEFDRLLDLADRPDRIFHSTLSRDSLHDLSRALRICKHQTSTTTESKRTNDLLGFYIENVIRKEELRLKYTLTFSMRDKLRAVSLGRDADDRGRSDVGRGRVGVQMLSALSRLLDSISSSWIGRRTDHS